MVSQLFPMNIDASISLMERLFRNFEQSDRDSEDRFVSILISKPGVGKSATIAKMANRMGYSLIDLNLACIEPTDIIGLGAREKVEGKWQTMPALPQWAETALAGNCIILVDEFNNTTQDVLAGFQKMFSDFVIDGKKLPKTTHIIGACNPPGDDAIYAAKKLSGAFRRRLCMIPVTDDFAFVANRHNFVMPRGFVLEDLDDLSTYVDYRQISSAVIDNIFIIAKYPDLTELEKVSLINGFGSKALDFAKTMGLFSDEIFARGYKPFDSELTYSDWKREPKDICPEHQQLKWGQESLLKSVSYGRSKSFIEKVENENVYRALLQVLKTRFEDDYELDEMKPVEDRTAPII